MHRHTCAMCWRASTRIPVPLARQTAATSLAVDLMMGRLTQWVAPAGLTAPSSLPPRGRLQSASRRRATSLNWRSARPCADLPRSQVLPRSLLASGPHRTRARAVRPARLGQGCGHGPASGTRPASPELGRIPAAVPRLPRLQVRDTVSTQAAAPPERPERHVWPASNSPR